MADSISDERHVERTWASPHLDEVLERAPRFVDVTLREGQQAARVAFSAKEVIEIAQLLEQLGVDCIQAGFAASDGPTINAVRSAVQRPKVAALLIGLADGWKEDARAAADAGADVIEILIRSGDRQLAGMGLSRRDAIRRSEETVAFAGSLGVEVWFGPSFASVAAPEHLGEMYRVAASLGASHFTVTDTLGVATPAVIARLVGLVQETTDGGSVGVHCHDDLGLATANTLAGLLAGAHSADCTLNGYGERAGNCPLDEVATALAVLYGCRTGIRLDLLTTVARRVSEMVGVPLPVAKPVTGSDVFAQKLEIHVKLTDRDPTLLEPFPPELVGNARSVRLGVHSGPTGVRAKAAELGLPTPPDAVMEDLLREIEDLARAHESVDDDRFRALVQAATRGAV